MAKLTTQDFFARLGGSPLSRAYLLAGEETYFIDRALTKLVGLALEGAPRDFNLDVFYGKDSRADDVAAQASTLPMMAERRVVVLKEADRLRDLAPIKAYLKDPAPETVFVMTAADADRSKEKTLADALPKDGVHAHFYHHKDYELPRFIKSIAAESGAKVEDAAAEYLVEALGDNLALVEAELNKVFNYIGDRKTVTEADVRDSVGDFGLPLVYDLIDAVADKRAGAALDTLAKLLREGEVPVVMLGTMSAHWRKLVEAKEKLRQGADRAQLSKQFRLFFGAEKRFWRQVDGASDHELARAFHLMQAADTGLKGGSGLTPALVMERLVLGLSGAGGF